jgi:hypothetical protein
VNEETKAICTVSELARMCGPSTGRFYQLLRAGIFPPPMRQSETGRPYYTEALQEVCLEVRRRHRGVNGKPVLFYTKRRARLEARQGVRQAKTSGR